MYQVSCFYHKMHDSSQNCYISAPLIRDNHDKHLPGRVAQLVRCMATVACLTANQRGFDPYSVPYFSGDRS